MSLAFFAFGKPKWIQILLVLFLQHEPLFCQIDFLKEDNDE